MSGINNPVFDRIEENHELKDKSLSGTSSHLNQYSKNETKSKENENSEEHFTTKCGWINFRPESLQRFLTPKWALFWLCCCVTLQGMIVNGFVNVVITTIEKKFDLKSSQTGLIAGSYDFVGFLFLIPVSYFGGRPNSSKPRYIGLGIIVLGFGSLIFTLPHFISGSYKGQEHKENICYASNSTQDFCKTDQAEIVESNSGLYLAIFIFAQCLNGAGATPFFTLCVTYLDENVSKKMSSLYIGIYFTMAVVGPALGYVIGGKLLNVYVDFLNVDPLSFGLTPHSDNWIGAWWIGFLVIGIFCILISIPILAYPASLPGAAELAKQRVSEAHQSSSASTNITFSKIQEIPHAFKVLLRNPAFVMINFAGACDGFFITGFAAFLPKILQKQFSLNASTASFLMGLVVVPSGGGGTFLGGYLVKKLNLQCKGILKMTTIISALSIITAFGFTLSCPNVDFAGVTIPYNNSTDITLDGVLCTENCGCSKILFDPICGSDNVVYYSPCFAGCREEITLNEVKVYNNCSCFDAPVLFIVDESTGNNVSYSGINTSCESTCSNLWLFIAVMFLNIFLTFTISMPSTAATLRVVKSEERSIALGIQWLKVRFFGSTPGPIVIGALIDRSCILWHESCEDEGACIEYDNVYMMRYMFFLALGGKIITFLCYALAWKFYKPPQEIKNESR